jgi:hypothetical protein
MILTNRKPLQQFLSRNALGIIERPFLEIESGQHSMFINQTNKDRRSIDWQRFVGYLILLYKTTSSFNSITQGVFIANSHFAGASDNHSFEILGPHDCADATTSGSTVSVSDDCGQPDPMLACRANACYFCLCIGLPKELTRSLTRVLSPNTGSIAYLDCLIIDPKEYRRF